MECISCNKWIHSKCEGLSDDQYQILSMLPESVEFCCQSCSKDATPYWRKAIKSELKSSFNNVLRLLSKSGTARSILKWSPLNNNTPNNRAITAARKLQFSDDNEDVEEHSDINLDIPILNKNTSKESASSKENTDSSRLISPSMIDIKNKLYSNEYSCITEFSRDMVQVITTTHSEELLNIYYNILKKVFPWYDPKQPSQSDSFKSPQNTASSESARNSQSQENFNSNTLGINMVSDTRACSLCKGVGDGLDHMESRLLYCGQNEWVHANCALWSSEVYEEIDGSLQNVHNALSRGRSMRCAHCKQKGASVGCCSKGCYETYHFNCARAVNCYFMHDKTVFCPTHDLSDKHHLMVSASEFDIRRSVYVELDRKKKKVVEVDKVHFMVGSLSVTKLGKIIPLVSDHTEAIIPAGFVCSRLFWSTVEPWKLVSYVITTTVLNSQVNTVFLDKNFTVDHSLSKAVVERKLKDILVWQKDLSKSKSEVMDFEDEEEPQNGHDLLSPELADAILEELPYDLLDGILVQDIFPKLNYEELLNVDFRSSEIAASESNEVSKKLSDPEDESDSNKSGRELKRSKSELFPQIGNPEKLSKARSQQRSCSLTLSCKLDSSLAPAIKKRKMAPRDNNMFFQLLQVDGAYDSSSASECGSPIHESSDTWELPVSEEPVTCERCQCTYRTNASYKRHLETCEVISTSESDSECFQDIEGSKESTTGGNDTENSIPVSVNVCQSGEPYVVASYETYSSYQSTQNEVHTAVVNTQTFQLSSEATTSEIVTVPDNTYYSFQPQVLEPKPVAQQIPHQTNLAISLNQSSVDPKPTFTINQQTAATLPAGSNQAQYCVNQSIPLCVQQQASAISVEPSTSIAISQPMSIGQTGTIINQTPSLPAVEIQPQPITIQPVSYSHEVQPILNIAPRNQIAIDPNMLNTQCPNIINSVVTQTLNVPQNHWVKPVVKPTLIAQKPIKTRIKPRSLAAKRSRIQTNGTVLIPQTATPTQSVILQHVASPNVVPTFVDAFQQQAGQNLQYVATITPQMNSTITQQSPVLHLQPDGNFISLVPGVQPTMVIQQPRMITDQLILDGNGSLTWAPQPIYYGFETIVQNTVMQSQQFLPTTVPGVLTANSSYSTTTQVFQTSKLEPVLDVSSNGFVLLNSGQLVNSQPVQVPQFSQTVTPSTVTNTALPTPATPQNKPQIYKPKETINATVPRPVYQSPKKTAPPATTVNIANSSINLPSAPFVSEQGIPTIVVTPTPKAPTGAQVRPMSRVLPMQTNTKETKKPVVESKPEVREKEEIVDSFNKLVDALDNMQKEEILDDLIKTKQETYCDKEENDNFKIDASLKVVFQKQNTDGIYKISNNFCNKTPQSVQIVPLKPIKSKSQQNPVIPITTTTTTTMPSTPVPFEKIETTKPQNPPPVETKSLPDKQESISTPTPAILYTIETQDGFRYCSTSISDLWTKVFETVQAARVAHNMSPLPVNAFNMISNLLGFKTNGLKYLIEQLPGAGKCIKYKPSFYFASSQSEADDEFLIGHSCGSIRCVPYTRRNEPNDMFGWLASKHRKPEDSLIDTELVSR